MSGGAVRFAAAALSSLLLGCTSAEPPVVSHWLEVEIVDWRGRPFQGYALTLYDDIAAEGRPIVLDEQGQWTDHEFPGAGPAFLELSSLVAHRQQHGLATETQVPTPFAPRPDDILISWEGRQFVTLENVDRRYRIVAKSRGVPCFSC